MIINVVLLALLLYVASLVYRYEKYRQSSVSLDLKLPELSAYAWPHAYVDGDTIGLRVHAVEDYTGQVYRAGKDSYVLITEFSGAAKQQRGKYEVKTGHDWEVTDSIPTEGWRPGFYLIRLSLVNASNIAFNVPVLLRSGNGNRVLVVAPTNTWQAYNQYGGKSNYRDSVTPKDLKALFSVCSNAYLPDWYPTTTYRYGGPSISPSPLPRWIEIYRCSTARSAPIST